ncbi:MAG: peptidylprolyl isomerase [Wolbachia endosymbiont of Meromenopon meropis]|nr:peptidylprolyl isomerase [Wolbachia endosymbiont of Meromenopon meropis]
MIKKIILQLLISIVIIFTLTFSFTFTVIQINKNRPKREDKFYELNTVNDNLLQTIIYHLVRPILESLFDNYIEKHGFKEYLRKTMQQEEKREDLMNFYEITEGNGSTALCGQTVLFQANKIPDSLSISFLNQVSNIILKIGQDNWKKEIGLGIIGMKEGGERVITVKNTKDNNKIDLESYYIKLIEIKDKYPDSANNMIIFNNLINREGQEVKCGDEVLVKYNIMKYNGEYIINDQIAKFKVGDKKLPLAIELGVIGMRVSNNRAIISSSELLDVIDGSKLIKDIDLEEKNVFIINLSLNSLT